MTSTERDLIPVVDYARASTDKSKDEHSVEDQQRLNDRTAPHSAEYDEFRSHTTRQENEQLALTDLIDGKDVT